MPAGHWCCTQVRVKGRVGSGTMHQQINFYQAEFRIKEQVFSATTLLKGCGAIVLVMVFSYVFAAQKLSGMERELQIMNSQEAAAVARLEKLGPVITAIGGEQIWAKQLDEATRLLEEKQLVLSLLQGSTLGDTRGFSRYLRSLARQDTDGLWLTRISLSALGDKTTLAGQALRAELVPAYLQGLAEEPPFATQRFQQFQIEGAEEPGAGTVTFSMNSEAKLMAGVADSQ